jgi:hypothetical protein
LVFLLYHIYQIVIYLDFEIKTEPISLPFVKFFISVYTIFTLHI